jgi:hypothetical protein
MEPLLRLGWRTLEAGESQVGIVEAVPVRCMEGWLEVVSHPAHERGGLYCHLLSRPAADPTMGPEPADAERCVVCRAHHACDGRPGPQPGAEPVCPRHSLKLECEPTPCCGRRIVHCPDCCLEAIAGYVQAQLEAQGLMSGAAEPD